MSSSIVTITIGIIVLGLTYEFVFKDTLAHDTTPEGWAMKIILVLIGLAMVIFPIVALFKGKEGQRAAIVAARRGVTKGLREAHSQVLKPITATGKLASNVL